MKEIVLNEKEIIKVIRVFFVFCPELDTKAIFLETQVSVNWLKTKKKCGNTI